MNLNNNRFQQFLRQAKGADAFEASVSRADKRDAVILKYSAKVAKKRQLLTGEWSIPRGERSEDEVATDIQSFLEEMRKHFVVTRGEGLADERYAGATEAKGTPIKGEAPAS